jgi:hypothetical protein
MRKLLKNKKGFDWAFLIVGVTVACLIFLFFQLNSKLETFDRDIGFMQMDVVGSSQKSENLLFYLDQSSRLAACDAVYALADKGGFANPPKSAQILPAPIPGFLTQSYTYWVEGGTKKYENHNFYKDFETVFNDNFKKYLNSYNLDDAHVSMIPLDNYEFMVTDNLVSGAAIKNIELVMPASVSSYGLFARYVFKPSFAIDFKTGIKNYFTIEDQMQTLLDCDDMSACVNNLNTPGLKWSFAQLPDLQTYIFTVEQENIDCSFKKDPPKIRFALEKPVKVPEIPSP